MADLGGYDMRRQPTAAEVVGRLKDDGDFDALRRAIIRKVKDNVSTCPLSPNPYNHDSDAVTPSRWSLDVAKWSSPWSFIP
jgi:hypothetical protein